VHGVRDPHAVSFGRLSDEQQHAVRPLVVGKVVYDLGAGSGELARLLVCLGAERVVAVDKEDFPPLDDPRIERRFQYFEHCEERPELVFLSWPMNYQDPGLFRLVSSARLVVYVGKNTDGTSCGWPSLFRALSAREILCYKPERRNTLICYGDKQLVRPLVGEEYAAINTGGTWLTYEQAERLTGLNGVPQLRPTCRAQLGDH
jgi:hypothetical protein